MSAWEIILSQWDFEPSVLLGCAAFAGVYAGLRGGRVLDKRGALFMLGMLVLLISLISPIDVLGDEYLFSTHMVQHLMMILITPPLLILGIPEDLARKALAWRPIDQAERVLSIPLLAWLLAEGTTWIWHAPPFYEAAIEHEGIHVFQHMTFLITATIFWWPILTPLKERRLSAPAGMLYLVTAAISSSLLGILLAFAPAGIYPAYLHPEDPQGLLTVIRGQWGITPEVDQRAGGMLMWVPGGVVYFIATLAALARWFAEPDADEETFAESEAVAYSK